MKRYREIASSGLYCMDLTPSYLRIRKLPWWIVTMVMMDFFCSLAMRKRYR
jgi:hypothetical protein